MQEGANYDDVIVLTTTDDLKTATDKLRRLNNKFRAKHEGHEAFLTAFTETLVTCSWRAEEPRTLQMT